MVLRDKTIDDKLMYVPKWHLLKIKIVVVCCFEGIWGDETMADKLMYIPNDDSHNYPCCRLQLVCWNVFTLNLMNKPIKIKLKSSRIISQRVWKRYYETLGTSVINSQLSPPSPTFFGHCYYDVWQVITCKSA